MKKVSHSNFLAGLVPYSLSLKGILLLFFLPLSIQGQEYYFNNFSGKDGLAQSQVYALLEDQRGYLWMGTWGGGVSQFDGLRFVNHTEAGGLVSNYIYSLCEDISGNIWIGTDKGISRFNGKDYESFLTEGRTQVYCLTTDPKGRVWIGTHKGLYIFTDEKMQRYDSSLPALQKAAIRSCFVDAHGFIWLGSNRGVFVISPAGNIRHLDESDGWNGSVPFSIIADEAGTIWVGTEGGGVQWSNGTVLRAALDKSNGLSSDKVVRLHRSSGGKIWIGTTNGGISIWNPVDSSLTYLQEQDGLESNDVRSIIEDSWNNHWVGTSGGGVSKYSGQQFVLYDEADGLIDKEVYGVGEDTLGQIWLSTSRGVSRFDGRSFKHFDESENWLTAKSRTVLADQEGRLWAGYDNVGLGLFAADTFRLINTEENWTNGLVRDIVQDSVGNIWVATTRGGILRVISKFMDSTAVEYSYEQYNRSTGFPANYIYALMIDLEGRVWVASRYLGLGYFKADGQAQFFDQRHGLPDAEVRTLAMDSLGNCWAGTARRGIFNFKLEKDTLRLKTFSTQDGLTSNNIYQLIFDQENNLWVGNEKGVDQIFLDEALEISELKAFGYDEGFKGGETCNSAVLCSSKGDLWFGTMNGLTHYLPGEGRKNRVAPKLHLRQVRLFYQPIEKTDFKAWSTSWGGLREGLVLPYRQNSLGFFFKGINHSNPEKVQYQWKLEGHEQQWSPMTSNNSVNYSNLPPNDYVFKVRAYNEDQVTNAHPVEVAFSIDAPFWQHWWFRLSAFLLSVIAMVIIFRVRVNQVTQKAKEEKEKLEMEKNLLLLEQKALQLQMNPHFIFNALNSIQHLISEKDHQKARYQLAKFSKLMRSTLENSRSNLLLLSEEIQSLESYLALEQFSRDRSFAYQIEIPDDLDPDSVYIPPMMIQPFVENAIIHGVAHLTDRKGVVVVQFELATPFLICTIEDNGIGRTKAKAIKSQQGEQHKSTALQVTRERLELLERGTTESLKISDLISAEGVAIGTRVVLKVPLLDS